MGFYGIPQAISTIFTTFFFTRCSIDLTSDSSAQLVTNVFILWVNNGDTFLSVRFICTSTRLTTVTLTVTSDNPWAVNEMNRAQLDCNSVA